MRQSEFLGSTCRKLFCNSKWYLPVILALWISGAAVSDAFGQTGSGVITQETIAISLPIYVISLIATATATWTVCKYDNRKSEQIDDLRQDKEELKRRIETLEKLVKESR